MSDPTLSDNDCISQQVINMQILSQLQFLGRRLDDMEARNCKTTSNQSKTKNKSVRKKVKSTETPTTVATETNNSLQILDLNTLRKDALIQLKLKAKTQRTSR